MKKNEISIKMSLKLLNKWYDDDDDCYYDDDIIMLSYTLFHAGSVILYLVPPFYFILCDTNVNQSVNKHKKSKSKIKNEYFYKTHFFV